MQEHISKMTESTMTRTAATSIAVLISMAVFCFTLGRSSNIQASLFEGGRGTQFLCFGGTTDIIKLNNGEPNGPNVLGLNLFRRYSFTVRSNFNRARCITVGVGNDQNGDVDLFLCKNPDAEDCFANPNFSSISPDSEEEITTGFGAQTWYVIVKANLDAVTYTVRCDEKDFF
ncbi:hypothetical protein FisN_8Lh009 [Fistulifera solaris]|uniref:Uncharacterized protein n=1 Tax=Fistulifera solaris TaxID=1519565 RepID=A0A1Z5JD43_FISSO|nr:hypothetical protein FisN_8Lh009 [Fistulifera solaris]|eukprot:GAX11923.1 hypothetical protein FisN_8Lh009 [Fistulifera solaris]